MKYVIVFCWFCSFTIVAFSQENDKIDPSIEFSIKDIYKDINDDKLTLAWRKSLIKHQEFSQKDDLKGIIIVLNCQGAIHTARGNETDAVELYIKALSLVDDYDSSVSSKISKSWLRNIKGTLHMNIGNSYYHVAEFETSMKHYEQALVYNNVSDTMTESTFLGSRVFTYLNMAGAYIEMDQIDSAEAKISMIYQMLGDSIYYPINTSIKKIQCWVFILREEYDKALSVIEQAIALDELNGNLLRLEHSKIVKGEILYRLGEEKQAIALFIDCLSQVRDDKDKLAYKRECLTFLYEIYVAQNDSLTALSYLIDLNEVKDTLNKRNSQSKIESILLSQKFKTLELDAARSNKEAKIEEEKRKLKSALMGVSFVLILLIVLFIGVQMRKKFKRSILSGKKEMAYSSTQLASKNMAINSAISKLEAHLSCFSENDNVQIKGSLNDLRSETKNNDFWEDFAIRFKDADPQFYKNLLSLPVALSKSEVRLCTFIKLNFTSKEISSITKQSVNSINVAKHRLKSKIELAQEQNLNDYLNSL
ncbi:MAG: hypothetical protein COB65_01190 [Thalassobium sp.]|nr:MAG: hypothetical protein COB65_01190 [Thalassobium sp.]